METMKLADLLSWFLIVVAAFLLRCLLSYCLAARVSLLIVSLIYFRLFIFKYVFMIVICSAQYLETFKYAHVCSGILVRTFVLHV